MRWRSPSVHDHLRDGVSNTCHAPTSVLPQLVALGRPVVAEHLQRAVGAIDLQRRRAVSLHREAGRHDAEHVVAEVEEDLVVVECGDVDGLAVDDPARCHDAGHRLHTAHRTEQAGEAGQVVDPEVEQRPAGLSEVPLAPVGARPSVSGTSEGRPADRSGAELGGHRLIGRAEDHRRRTPEVSVARAGGREQLGGLRPGHRHRLLDEDVLAGPKCFESERPVLGHRRQDDDDVDVVAVDQLVVIQPRMATPP